MKPSKLDAGSPVIDAKITVFATLLEAQANLPSTFQRTAEGVKSSKSVARAQRPERSRSRCIAS
jgi:hypothetical protein